MDICVYKKGYFKETHEVQNAINWVHHGFKGNGI